MCRSCVRMLLALCLTLPLGFAHADDLDYDWLTAGVVQDDPSGGSSAHGWFADGSYAISSDFALQGSFYRYGLDVADCHGVPPTSCNLFSHRFDTGLVGAGWHLSLADKMDLLMDAGLGRYDDERDFSFEQFNVGTCPVGTITITGGCADVSHFDDKGTSYELDAGIRIGCDCSLEFRALLGGMRTYRSVSFLSAEADWRFLEPVALMLQARHLSSSDNEYRIGLRYLY